MQLASVFYVYEEGGIYKFNAEMNEIPDSPEQNPTQFPIKNKKISNEYSFVNTFEIKYPEKQEFFHVAGRYKRKEFYVKSNFVPDEISFPYRGHFQSIQVLSYDSTTHIEIAKIDFSIRNTSKVIDYQCQVMKDGNVLITGIYQDVTAIGRPLILGRFAKIISKDLSSISDVSYLELMQTEESLAVTHPNYMLMFMVVFSQNLYDGEISNSDSYMFFTLAEKYTAFEINKRTGVMKMLNLNAKYEKSDKLFLGGFMDFVINDSTKLIFFNDHKNNLGLSGSDTNVIECTENYSGTSWSYVTYSVGKGFSERKMAFDCKKEYCFILLDPFSSSHTAFNAEGVMEIITPAFDKEKKTCQFYKIRIIKNI